MHVRCLRKLSRDEIQQHKAKGTLLIASCACGGDGLLSCESRISFRDEDAGDRIISTLPTKDSQSIGIWYEEEVRNKYAIRGDYVILSAGNSAYATEIKDELEAEMIKVRASGFKVHFGNLEQVIMSIYNKKLDDHNEDPEETHQIQNTSFIVAALDIDLEKKRKMKLKMKFYGYSPVGKRLGFAEIKKFDCDGSGSPRAKTLMGRKWRETSSTKDLVCFHHAAMVDASNHVVGVGGIHSYIKVKANKGQLEIEDHDKPISKLYRVLKLEGDLKDQCIEIHNLCIDDAIKEALVRRGISQLFPIQRLLFDIVRTGRDIICRTRTGSGKTLAYGLPMIHKMVKLKKSNHKKWNGGNPLALVLVPTPEFGSQVVNEFCQSSGDLVTVFFSADLPRRMTPADSGRGGFNDALNSGSMQREGLMSYKQFSRQLRGDILPAEAERRYQEYRSKYITSQQPFFDAHKDGEWLKDKYQRKKLLSVIERRNDAARTDNGVDVLVCTPGSFVYLWKLDELILSKLQFTVLVETDQLLNLGFHNDIETILPSLPAVCQIIMFARATMSEGVRELTSHLHGPLAIDLVGDSCSNVRDVGLYSIEAEKGEEAAVIAILIKDFAERKKTIVFTQTKTLALELASSMSQMLNCRVLHEGSDRGAILSSFRLGAFDVLVATDVATNGIDVPHVDFVIHYDPSVSPRNFILRTKRTGRTGDIGSAVLVHTNEQTRLVEDIEQALSRTLTKISWIGKGEIQNVIRSMDCGRKGINKPPVPTSTARNADGGRKVNPFGDAKPVENRPCSGEDRDVIYPNLRRPSESGRSDRQWSCGTGAEWRVEDERGFHGGMGRSRGGFPRANEPDGWSNFSLLEPDGWSSRGNSFGPRSRGTGAERESPYRGGFQGGRVRGGGFSENRDMYRFRGGDKW